MHRQNTSIVFLSGIQWFFFIFANTIVVPISIANTFQLDPNTITTMIQISLIGTGIVCVFQGWIGHKLPIMEGHSGLMWGVILNLGISAQAMGMSLSTIGGGIATGTLLACGVTLLFAIFNWIHILEFIFKPMVMSVYLFLLSFQLIFIFFKGMLKIDETGTLNIPISLFSVGIVILVSVLKMKGNKLLSNFSILIGLILGWLGFAVLFPNEVKEISYSSEIILQFFPLGTPNLEMGIVIISFLAGMLNLTNTMASIKAASKLVGINVKEKQYRSSIAFTSISTTVGTFFGLVPYTPFTSSIGFLESTRIFDRKPFLIGGVILTIVGIIPMIDSVLATMPITVGNAVLFVAYVQLFGTAYSSLNRRKFNSNTVFRIAVPILVGVSIMNVSPQIFNSLPIVLRPFFSNGLIMGVLLSVLLESIVKWSKYDVEENQHLDVS